MPNLFTIDVDAEIRKLAGRRFKSAGEPVVELIRFASGLKPTRIAVEIKYRYVKVSCEGASLDSSLVKQISTIFDSSKPDELRHSALVDLEDERGLGILAAFATSPAHVIIQWTDDNQPRALEFKSKKVRKIRSQISDGFSIKVFSRRMHKRAEQKFVTQRCRFSTISIRLNQRRINRGITLKDCVIKSHISNSRLEGIIGLPDAGDLCRLTLLHQGIVAEEIVRPPHRGRVFNAVIEENTGDFKATWLTLENASKRLLKELAGRYDDLDETQKSRALEMLFERYRHSQDETLLSDVRAFEQVGAAPLTIGEIRQLAKSHTLFAVDLDASLGQYNIGKRHVLRLDREGRKFLDNDLGIALANPPSAARFNGVSMRLVSRIRAQIEKAFDKVGTGKGFELADEELNKGELFFLNTIRNEIKSGAFELPHSDRPFNISVAMAERQRKAWLRMEGRSGRAKYLIGRSNPNVAQMIAAVKADKSNIYPTLIALTKGHDGYASSREVAQQVILLRRS